MLFPSPAVLLIELFVLRGGRRKGSEICTNYLRWCIYLKQNFIKKKSTAHKLEDLSWEALQRSDKDEPFIVLIRKQKPGEA